MTETKCDRCKTMLAKDAQSGHPIGKAYKLSVQLTALHNEHPKTYNLDLCNQCAVDLRDILRLFTGGRPQ